MPSVCRIENFHSIVPRHSIKQEDLVDWLAGKFIHSAPADKKETFEKYFRHFFVSASKIAQRNVDLPDFLCNGDAEAMLYPESGSPPPLDQRMSLYKDLVVAIFERFYEEPCRVPAHLLHVTCTGYLSPSPAQIIVGRRDWSTQVMNAYHMGCYASLPAIRMGQAFAKEKLGQHVDIVHTELCSFHMNTRRCTPEQIVISSLFGDGYIKYSMHSSENSKNRGYTLLALKEKIIKDTSHMMTWVPGQYSFEMSLDREVPTAIRDHIYQFASDLCKDAGIEFKQLLSEGHFAIHPGGPKIIDLVMERLKLREDQVSSSKKILLQHGNMSSATLPHVWADLLESGIPTGSLVFSVAFGPGLTMFGSLFRV